MVNWANYDRLINSDSRMPRKLKAQILSELKYERNKGLSGMTKEDFENIKELRKIAKESGLFTLEHPIIEDDLNLLRELEAVA